MTNIVATGISVKLTAAEKAAIRTNIDLDKGVRDYNAYIESIFTKATLDLNFVKNEHKVYEAFGSVNKLITDAITTARNSTATYQSPMAIASAAINIPRIAYDPVTGSPLGLLTEETKTNLLLHSQYTGANGETPPTGWVEGGTDTGTTTTSASPRFPGAIRITATGTVQRENIAQIVTLAAATTYTLSCYFAAGTSADNTVMRVTTNDTPTGAITLAASAVTVAGTYSITFTTVAGGNYAFYIGLGCTGNATGTVIHETPQLEVGSFPTSYIPTTTAAMQRFADGYYKNLPVLTEGTVFVDCIGEGPVNGVNQVAAYISDGTINSRVVLRRNNSLNGSSVLVVSGGSVIYNPSTTQKAKNVRLCMAVSFKAGSFVVCEAGVIVASQSSGAAPIGMNTVGIGNIGTPSLGGESLSGTIARIAVFPRALTNVELQAITL